MGGYTLPEIKGLTSRLITVDTVTDEQLRDHLIAMADNIHFLDLTDASRGTAPARYQLTGLARNWLRVDISLPQ